MKLLTIPRIILICAALLLSGCGATNVVVDSKFPTALVKTLPLEMGVYYSDDFSNYVFEEKVKPKPKKPRKKSKKAKDEEEKDKDKDEAKQAAKAKKAKPPKEPKIKLTLATGKSQVELFDTLFRSYFARTVRVNGIPVPDDLAGLDAVISPEIEELQYTVPRDTNSKIFEVWFKFKLSLFKPGGDLITSWPITAYGKTPTGFMKSKEVALERAAVVALRDAGAHFASSFTRLPDLQRWLEEQMSKTQTAVAESEPSMAVEAE